MSDPDVINKLNILIYIFGAQFCFIFITSFWRSFNEYNAKRGTRIRQRVEELDNQGDFEGILEWCDSCLEKRPNDVHLLWGRARANYQLGNFKSALNQFEKIKLSEPMWEADAEKYIKAIHERTENT